MNLIHFSSLLYEAKGVVKTGEGGGDHRLVMFSAWCFFTDYRQPSHEICFR